MIELQTSNTDRTARAHKKEIQNYIAQALAKEKGRGLKDVYITDHQPRQKKYHTNNRAEDLAFYKYEQSLKEYNDEPVETVASTAQYSGRYKRGSLA